jgi:hypothetical protein
VWQRVVRRGVVEGDVVRRSNVKWRWRGGLRSERGVIKGYKDKKTVV